MFWKPKAEASKNTTSAMADDEDVRNEWSCEIQTGVQDSAPDRPSHGLVAAKLGESRTNR